MPQGRQIDIDTETAEPAVAPKIDGRSKAARAARAAAPQPTAPVQAAPTRAAGRNNVRAAVHEPVREGRVPVIGRNGEVLTRKRTSTNDIFHVPPEIIPAGWEYQWCAVSVVGNTEILMDQNLMMAENGWRAVPASRYPGRFMPAGHTGNIVRGGQLLMERPKSLSDEARAEDIANAKRLITDRDQSLMGGKANLRNSMPHGFEADANASYKGRRTSMSIDPAHDIPMPSHTLAEPGE